MPQTYKIIAVVDFEKDRSYRVSTSYGGIEVRGDGGPLSVEEMRDDEKLLASLGLSDLENAVFDRDFFGESVRVEGTITK